MREETILEKQVYRYLVDLGYPEPLIASRVRTREGHEVDFVVNDQDGPRVVVEVKSGKAFPADKELSRLRFHPHVRKLQSHATELGALYYLLTNGESFLWFTTDDSGRPQLLEVPVRPTSVVDTTTRQPSRETILGVLWELKDLFRKKASPKGDEPAAAILAKLLSEHGDNRLRQALLTPGDDRSVPLPVLGLSLQDLPNRRYLPEALEILDTVSLSDAAPQDVLSALDEALIRTHWSRELQVARWLADFLVRLSQLRRGDVVLDICSHYGNILAAASMPHREVHPASVWGISRVVQSAIWAKIQLVVLGLQEDRILVGGWPPYDIRDAGRIPTPTHIIAAPPFGSKGRRPGIASTLSSKGVSKFEDLCLELAIEWVQPQGRVVIVVPESLLFAGGESKITREFVCEQTRVIAIFSLPSGALLPFSSVKTSVLVLDKEPSSRPYDVFMSVVEEFTVKDAFDSREIPQISKVLDAFQEWTGAQQIGPGSISWAMPMDELDVDNLTATRYLPLAFSGHEELTSPHPMVPLRRVTEFVKRGRSIRLDEGGDLPVIGPGAIRPMILDASSIGNTVEANLPSRPITVQGGDIVLNNIGMHLGSVAVIGEDVAGSFISQHVLLLRPDTSKILPEYLAAALNSDYVRPQIERRATGSIMPAVSVRRLDDVMIPLPDLATQRHIVDAIYQARDDLERKREQLERAEARFKEAVGHLSAGGEVEE